MKSTGKNARLGNSNMQAWIRSLEAGQPKQDGGSSSANRVCSSEHVVIGPV
jgi:hypothetical protein